MNHLSTSPSNEMLFCSLDDIRFFFDIKMVNQRDKDRIHVQLFAEELFHQDLSGIAMAVSEPITAMLSSTYITKFIQILLSDGQTRWIYYSHFCSSRKLLYRRLLATIL